MGQSKRQKANGKCDVKSQKLVGCFRLVIMGVIIGFCVDVWAMRPTVRDVQFDGAHAVSEDVLNKGLIMRRGMPVDSALVVADMQQILSHYRTLGYWQARVHYPDIVVQKDQASIHFRIEERRRTRIDSVTLSGELVFDREVVEAALSTKSGMVFTAARIQGQLSTLLKFYENRGYPFCALEPEVTFEARRARVQIRVVPGPVCLVDTVVFEGNDVTRDDALIREMRLEIGAVYDQRMIDRALRHLRRLPFLVSVEEPDVKRQGDRTVLIVRVKEARTARVEGGVGYAPQTTGDGLTGAFALDIHNVAGGGRLGTVAWKRTGVGVSNLLVRYQEPWVLDKPISADLEIAMGERVGFSEWQVGFGTTARLWEGGSVLGQILRGQVLPDSSGLGIYEKSDRWAINIGLGVDYRDDFWNPRSGWSGDASFELGRVQGLHQSNIRRSQAVNLQTFYSMGARSVWAVAGHVRWVSQVGGVPDDARIRVGGANSIRGYREEAFWATEVGWVSLEWRYLVGARSRLFIFGDAGVLQDLTGRVVPVGYGAGMVLQSQMGMIGFDVGWGRRDGFGDGKVHVRVVNAF